VGRFGLVPRWARELAMGRKTYNARSETVREKPSFRDAWAKGRRCLVPVHWIIEPNYESGAHVPWRIGMADWSPYAIAGLWDSWLDKDTGKEELSFTMLTVNADDHALMKRFHKPQDEKRMVVILPRHDEDRWLDCSVQEAWSMVRQFPADRMAAAPRDEPLERQLF
jgi:putative SOS response-associated peptidase YedK